MALFEDASVLPTTQNRYVSV